MAMVAHLEDRAALQASQGRLPMRYTSAPMTSQVTKLTSSSAAACMAATTMAHLEGCAVNQAKKGDCAPSPQPFRLPPPLSGCPRNECSPCRQQPHSADKQGAGVGRQLLWRGQEDIRLGL